VPSLVNGPRHLEGECEDLGDKSGKDRERFVRNHKSEMITITSLDSRANLWDQFTPRPIVLDYRKSSDDFRYISCGGGIHELILQLHEDRVLPVLHNSA
jgi:hypothetical protein